MELLFEILVNLFLFKDELNFHVLDEKYTKDVEMLSLLITLMSFNFLSK